jgi:hypothetical protein
MVVDLLIALWYSMSRGGGIFVSVDATLPVRLLPKICCRERGAEGKAYYRGDAPFSKRRLKKRAIIAPLRFEWLRWTLGECSALGSGAAERWQRRVEAKANIRTKRTQWFPEGSDKNSFLVDARANSEMKSTRR